MVAYRHTSNFINFLGASAYILQRVCLRAPMSSFTINDRKTEQETTLSQR